ncbi:MAG: hypothetical protein LUH43_00880 [Clostridia bacterium]|nr:hypothetical protein [Clostridia bacterium]
MKIKICNCCKKIFFLPAWLTVLIAVPSFALLILFFLFGGSMERSRTIEIPIYGLSAYALIIASTGIARIIGSVKKRLQSYALWNKLYEDARLRTVVTTAPGLFLNALYVFTNIGMGILNHTAWFIYLGVYYFFLTIMKSSLIHYLAKNRSSINQETEYRKYRKCGIALLMLNFVLVSECVYIVYKNQSFHYDGILIYAMAAMTFYSLIGAVFHVVRYRKYKSPVLSAVKAVKLTSAMVSMLALETAMIAQFGGEEQGDFRRMMTSLTASVVCIVELLIAVYMIYSGTRRIKREKTQQSLS